MTQTDQSPVDRPALPSRDANVIARVMTPERERGVLLDKAAVLIAAQGVARTTLAEVSVRSRRPRLSATRLFASRTAFMAAVAERIVDRFRQAARQSMGGQTGAAALESFVATFVCETKSRPIEAKAFHLMVSEAFLMPELLETITATRLAVERDLEPHFKVLLGDLRGDDVEARLCASTLVASLFGLSGRWLGAGDVETFERGCRWALQSLGPHEVWSRPPPAA
jgi:AcrR family transcriptional regulator